MKVEKKETINDNGTCTMEKKITTTEEDGWINARKTFGRRTEPRQRYFKGKSFSYHYQTNDPKVTKPALFIISIVLIVLTGILIGLALLFHSMTLLFFGIVFIFFAVVFIISNVRSIRRIEKKIREGEHR